jgi:hypothetical protein
VQVSVVCVGVAKTSLARTVVQIDRSGPVKLRSLIVEHMAAGFGPGIAATLLDGDGLRAPYVALIDGKNALQMAGLESLVADGAQVVFAVPVAGG